MLKAKEKIQQRTAHRAIVHRKRSNRLQTKTAKNQEGTKQKTTGYNQMNASEERHPSPSQQKEQNIAPANYEGKNEVKQISEQPQTAVLRKTAPNDKIQPHMNLETQKEQKDFVDKEEDRSRNVSDEQSENSKSEPPHLQEKKEPTRQNAQRTARLSTGHGLVREGTSSRGRKIKYRLYGQDEYFNDELVIRLPRQLCEEIVLMEHESKDGDTVKLKQQPKLPPKSKQPKRKREDFEEASYEEDDDEEPSDSDDEYIDEEDDDDDYVDSDSPVTSRRSSKGKSRSAASRLGRAQTTPIKRIQTHSQQPFLSRAHQLTPQQQQQQQQRLLMQQQHQQQRQQHQQRYVMQQQQQYTNPYLSSQMVRGGITTTASSLNVPMTQATVGMAAAQSRTPTTAAGGLTYLRAAATGAAPLTGYDTATATAAGYTSAYGYASQSGGMTATNRGSNMNIRSLLNTSQQSTTGPTLTMLNPPTNLMSASPYAAYSTAYTSSYTPVTSQSSYSLGGALPASYAYSNTPYNYATATGYGNVDRLSTLTHQQSTGSTTGIMGTSLSTSTNPMNISRVLEGTLSSDVSYGAGVGMESVVKDSADQKQRQPPGSSSANNSGGNSNNSSTATDVDSFINF
jgi:hypothetical protein